MRLKELERNSKFFLSSVLFSVLSVLMVAGLLIVGCSKTDGESSSSEDEIKFTVGSMPTKTAYSQEDICQLLWVTGDQVSIYCDQAGGGKTKADYDVTPIAATPENGMLSVAKAENNKGLRWNDDKTKQHNFYAVYPSIGTSHDNVAKVSGEEGVFTFDFPRIQYCETVGGYECGMVNEFVSGCKKNLRLIPEMHLAYMVAKQEGLMPTTEPAKLLFKPIATTLDITLQGPAEGEVEIESLSLELKNIPDDVLTLKNGKYQIQFDAKKDFSIDVSAPLMPYTSGISNPRFIVRLPQSGSTGRNYTLKPGECVTYTVFLPPVRDLKDVEVYCFGPGMLDLGKKVILKTEIVTPATRSWVVMPQFKSVKEITLYPNPVKIYMTENGEASLDVTRTGIKMSDGTTLTPLPTSGFKWEITDPNVATISGTSTGNSITLTGKKAGTTTVSVTFGGCTATATVEVVDVYMIILNTYYLDIKPGGYYGDLSVRQIKLSDGSLVLPDLDSGFKWEIAKSGVVWIYGSSSDTQTTVEGRGILNLGSTERGGSTTVKVTYRGKSAKATVRVFDQEHTLWSYYQWDAVTAVCGENPAYNTTKGNMISQDDAYQSCSNCLKKDQVERILAAGVYWVTDAPPRKYPDGTVSNNGLIIKKLDYISDQIEGVSATTPIKGKSYKELMDTGEYNFLPAGGHVDRDMKTIINPGDGGYFWTRTCDYNWTSEAYGLRFNANQAYINDDCKRYSGFMRT